MNKLKEQANYVIYLYNNSPLEKSEISKTINEWKNSFDPGKIRQTIIGNIKNLYITFVETDKSYYELVISFLEDYKEEKQFQQKLGIAYFRLGQ